MKKKNGKNSIPNITFINHVMMMAFLERLFYHNSLCYAVGYSLSKKHPATPITHMAKLPSVTQTS